MLKKDSRMAIVTFLNEDLEHKDRDYYFLSTRMLTYQLLHAEQTRIKAEHREYIDWVVGVGQRVEEWKRRQLMKDGAVVVEIKDIPLEPGFTAGEPRWQHVMNKLRLFEWTEYERVLFIDADMVLQAPLDDLLYSRDSVHPRLTDHSQKKDHEPPLPSKYVMVARPDIAYMDGHNHKFPDDPAMTSDYLNAGFWLIAPDKMMFDFIVGIINLENRPFATNLPEQNLLNYIFRHCESWSEEGLRCGVGDPQGPMPWVNAGSIWSSNRVSMADKNGGVRALHYKGWDCWDGDPLRNLWNEWKDKMEATLGRGYVPPPPPPPPPAPEAEPPEEGGKEGQAGETHEEGKPDDDGDWMDKEPGHDAAEWKDVEDLSPDAKAALEEQKDKANDSNGENKAETEKDKGGQAPKTAGEDDDHTPQE
jgi:alpha-N-acetylglucosamine transferase